MTTTQPRIEGATVTTALWVALISAGAFWGASALDIEEWEQPIVFAALGAYALLGVLSLRGVHRVERDERRWLAQQPTTDQPTLDRAIATIDQAYTTAANVALALGMIFSAATVAYVSLVAQDAGSFLRLAPRAVAATALGLVWAALFTVRGQQRTLHFKNTFQPALTAPVVDASAEGVAAAGIRSEPPRDEAILQLLQVIVDRLPTTAAHVDIRLDEVVGLLRTQIETNGATGTALLSALNSFTASADALNSATAVLSGTFTPESRDVLRGVVDDVKELRAVQANLVEENRAVAYAVSALGSHLERHASGMHELHSATMVAARQSQLVADRCDRLSAIIESSSGALGEVLAGSQFLADSIRESAHEIGAVGDRHLRHADEWLHRAEERIDEHDALLKNMNGSLRETHETMLALLSRSQELVTTQIPLLASAADRLSATCGMAAETVTNIAADLITGGAELLSRAVARLDAHDVLLNQAHSALAAATDSTRRAAAQVQSLSTDSIPMLVAANAALVDGCNTAAMSVVSAGSDLARTAGDVIVRGVTRLDAHDEVLAAATAAMRSTEAVVVAGTMQAEQLTNAITKTNDVSLSVATERLEKLEATQERGNEIAEREIIASREATTAAGSVSANLERLQTTLSREQQGLIEKHTEMLRTRAEVLMKDTFAMVGDTLKAELEKVATDIQVRVRDANDRAYEQAANRMEQELTATLDRTRNIANSLTTINTSLDKVSGQLHALGSALDASAQSTAHGVDSFAASTTRMVDAAGLLLKSVASQESESQEVAGFFTALQKAAEKLHDSAADVRKLFESLAAQKAEFSAFQNEMVGIANEFQIRIKRHETA